MMTDPAVPVPDPKLAPKPSAEMAAEGDHEGPVLTAQTRPSEVAIERGEDEAAPNPPAYPPPKSPGV